MTLSSDGYDLERIRVRMRSGVPFTANELSASIGGSYEANELVAKTITSFAGRGYIEQDAEGLHWTPTEVGKALFAPPYYVPPRAP